MGANDLVHDGYTSVSPLLQELRLWCVAVQTGRRKETLQLCKLCYCQENNNKLIYYFMSNLPFSNFSSISLITCHMHFPFSFPLTFFSSHSIYVPFSSFSILLNPFHCHLTFLIYDFFPSFAVQFIHSLIFLHRPQPTFHTLPNFILNCPLPVQMPEEKYPLVKTCELQRIFSN